MSHTTVPKPSQPNIEAAAAPPAEAPLHPIGFQVARPETRGDRVARETKFIVNEAIGHTEAGIGYFISQRLAELCPQKVLVEVREYAFDPVRFAGAGECSMQVRPLPYPHWILGWKESSDELGRVRNGLWQGWLEFESDGETLEVLIMHWRDGQHTIRHAFVLADSREIAVRFIRTVCAWNSRPREEFLVYDGSDWEKDKDLYRAIKGATFENLVLPAGMKEEILDTCAGFFDMRETYERYGIPWKRGILFLGPPGNGKTHAIKALVNALDQRCLYVKAFERGASPYRISEVFAKARACAPCILVFEDIDSLVNKYNRSHFLNELDGFAGNNGILTLATTNHPKRLDPAISERPSRFDRKFRFGAPELPERIAYLTAWNSGLETELHVPAAELAEIAECTHGFSFAYLKELCVSSIVAWMRAERSEPLCAILRQQAAMLRTEVHGKKSRRDTDSTRSEGEAPNDDRLPE